jgi:hypothetical protein
VAADWFRIPDWDDAARQDFETRLHRARQDNRPQYLRIKAIALREDGDSGAARELLQRVLDDPGPYDQLELPIAHELLGDIASQEGDWPVAEARYRHVLHTWPDLGSTTGTVEISLAGVLSRDNEAARRTEAMALLDSYPGRRSIQWNAALFRWHLVRIQLVGQEGDVATQQASAREALHLASQGSQFPRHGDVGTVHTTPQILDELVRLAAGKSRPNSRWRAPRLR